MSFLKQVFNEYLTNVSRPGTGELFDHLHQNGYFTSPSSSQYHGSCEGGNLTHSLKVTEIMLSLRNILAPEIPEESCIICGLFHDLGKSSYFNKPNYIENTLKNGKTGSKPFITNPDRLPIPHQIASLHILSKFIPLTEEESYAILFHNGLYTPDGNVTKGKETKLLLLLHWADMWSSRFIEGGYKPGAEGEMF